MSMNLSDPATSGSEEPFDGEVLYGMYEDELEKENIYVDPWENLSEEDQNAWNNLADRLQRKST